MAKGHSKYTVEIGEPYDESFPFETNGRRRGEAYLSVTPAMAKDFLAHSKGNRRIRDEYVARLAREMRTGSYDPMTRGKAFKFDTEGYLRDGHHTAFAIIEAARDDEDGFEDVAGVSSVKAGVIWGATEQQVRALDTNVDRTYADVLGVDGLKDAEKLAPVIRASISWDQGYRTDRGHYRPTIEELDERFSDEKDYFELALKLAAPALRQHSGVYAPAALRFHFYLLAKRAGEDTEALESIGIWSRTLGDDSSGWVTSNVLNTITKAKSDKANGKTRTPYVQYGYQLGLFNEAWNRFNEGRVNTKIQLGSLAARIISRDDYPVPEV